jgi:exodeoxyribonuclease VII large subunit
MSLFEPGDAGTVRRVSLVKLSAEVARSIASIGKIAVEGEVHRPTRGGRGAIYFTLKDRAAQISVICPASRASRCRAVAGERVSVVGTLGWSADRGQLSLIADEVMPVGAGAIAAMIADARRRLAADGLLERPRRPLPRLPRTIGVVCGTDAAVRADIESVVAVRFPGYPVEFTEVTVSGAGAVDAIVGAMAWLDGRPEIEVIVLARGGGDATQLLPFSDETLCRAVCGCSTPVVSAIGHEGDRPLCDEVADHRFGTPSLAAGAVVPARAELEAELERMWRSVDGALAQRMERAGGRLASIDRNRAVDAGLTVAAARLDRAGLRLQHAHPGRLVERAAERLGSLHKHMEALSPVRVLERGYAVVRRPDGAVVRSSEQVSPGDALGVQLASGALGVQVEEVTA